MAGQRLKSKVSWLRRLLLVALLLLVGGLVGLFLFGRAGQDHGRRKAHRERPDEIEEGVKLVGQDFAFTFTNGNKPVFRIRGASIRMEQDEVLYLDQVGLTMYDEHGQAYEAESQAASYNRSTNEGRLWGDVFLKGPSGLELRTGQIQMRDKGTLLLAPRPVRMLYAGKYFIRGESLRVDLASDLFVLTGDARVESLPEVVPPVSIHATRLVYERQGRMIRAEGDDGEVADLRRGNDRLRSPRISAQLSQDEASLVFVRAIWGVNGQTLSRQKGPPTTVHFSGQEVSVVMQPEVNKPRRIDLEGSDAKPAVLESVGGGITRTLVAPHFDGVLGDGVPQSAEGVGGVDVRETGPRPMPASTAKPAAKPATKPAARPASDKATSPKAAAQSPLLVRQAHGDRATAAFRKDGHVASVQLLDNVKYSDGEVDADGDRVALDLDSGRGEFFGQPVNVTSERGRLKAPHVVYTTADQVVHALDGVRGVLEQTADASLAGSPLGAGKGPVSVQSQEASWQRNPSVFRFKGDVRAWRGDNLLLTSDLTGDKQADQLKATGGVKTLWVPDEQTAATGAKPGGGPAPAKRGPIQVLSSELVYKEGAGLLTYTGNVRVDQEGKVLTCQQLDIELDKDRKAKTMTCTGQTHLSDPLTGRSVDGQKAVYQMDSRRVDMFGSPVTMKDREGNQLTGQWLTYSLDTGKVEVKRGNAPTAAGVK